MKQSTDDNHLKISIDEIKADKFDMLGFLKPSNKTSPITGISYKRKESDAFKINIEKTDRPPTLPPTPPPRNTNDNEITNNNDRNKKGVSRTSSMKRNIIIKTLNAFLKKRPPIEYLKKEGIILGS